MDKACAICGKIKNMLSWETKCYSCQISEHKKEIASEIQNGEIIETDCEDEIYCPWCGACYEPSDWDGAMYEEGEHEEVCDECERPFEITVNVSYSYDTKRK